MTADNYRGALLGCRFAYAVQAVGNNLIPILLTVFSAIYDTTLAQLSAIVTINFAVQIPADMLSVKICEKLGYRVSITIAQLISLCGLIMLGTLPLISGGNYAALVCSAALVSVGGGLTEVIVSPLTDSIPSGISCKKLAMLQSSYCWASCAIIAITSLTVGAIGYNMWYILPLALTALPICNIVIFSVVKLPEVTKTPPPKEIKNWGSNPTFYILIAIMFCAGAAEVTMTQFSSLFAEQSLGLNKQLGDVLAPCAFAAAMGLGRIAVGVSKGQNADKLMTMAAASCSICYITAAIIPLPAISLCACALCGFTVSVMNPCAYALASEKLAGGSVLLFSILAIAADIGCTAGPALTGAITDAVSKFPKSVMTYLGLNAQTLALRLGIAAGAIFPAILTVVCLILKKSKNKTLLK
ncbi:MAG: MFS transporter [Clostridia bacterium]|nr:MFS transporter [Clostridia bacterium]